MRRARCALILALAGCSPSEWTETGPSIKPEYSTLCFVDPSTGWVAARGGTLLATKDGGRTWTFSRVANHGDCLSRIRFRDRLHGQYLCFQEGCFDVYNPLELTTQDGGLTWNPREFNDARGEVDYGRQVSVGRDELWIDGARGHGLFIRREGAKGCRRDFPGLTWMNTEDFFFVDGNRGWVAGHAQHTPVILATTDAGASWTRIGQTDLPPKGDVSQIWFADAQRGWVLIRYGVERSAIYATSNGGKRWHREFGTSKVINAICFVDADHAFACGEDGLILVRR